MFQRKLFEAEAVLICNCYIRCPSLAEMHQLAVECASIALSWRASSCDMINSAMVPPLHAPNYKIPVSNDLGFNYLNYAICSPNKNTCKVCHKYEKFSLRRYATMSLYEIVTLAGRNRNAMN